MANVGLIVVGMRAQVSDLAKDLQAAGGHVNSFKSKNSGIINATLVPKHEGLTNFAGKVDQYGTQVKKLLGNAGAGQLAGIADAVGDIGGAIAALGPVAAVIVGVTVAVGALGAAIEGVRRIAASGMKAVDAAFKLGDRNKTIEALQKIISAGSSVGISITLADTAKVQGVNEEFVRLGNALAALGVKIVSDFQPEIVGAIGVLAEAVRLMGVVAAGVGKAGKSIAEGADSGIGRFVIGSIANAVGSQLNLGWLAQYLANKGIDAAAAAAKNPLSTDLTSLPIKESKNPAAFIEGSAAQYSASLEARQATTNPILAEAQRQVAEQKRTNQILEQIGSLLSGGDVREAARVVGVQ